MGAAFMMQAAGTAAQYFNQQNANSRAQGAQADAIQNQAGFREQANSAVQKQINNVKNSNPGSIASSETGNFVNALRKNVNNPGGTTTPGDTNFGAPTSALAPTGGGARYKGDVAKANTQTADFGTSIAKEVGNIDSAVRMRQNEGLQQQTLGTNLNTIGAESYTKNFVDQLRATAAGQTNPWVNMFSKAMGTGASAMAMNGGGSPAGKASTDVTFDASNPMGYAAPTTGWTGGSLYPQSQV
jgi:hypothetical protein